MSQKSTGLAVFLCWFFGVFGVHRFYVGRPVSAVLMLLTGGGLGIWVVIDLFVIAFGKFKDGSGDEMQSSVGLAAFVTITNVIGTAVGMVGISASIKSPPITLILVTEQKVAALPEEALGPSLKASLMTTLKSLEEETRRLGFYRFLRLETHSLLMKLLLADLADKNLSDEEYEEWSAQYTNRFKANHNELNRLIQARQSPTPAPTETPIPEEDEI